MRISTFLGVCGLVAAAGTFGVEARAATNTGSSSGGSSSSGSSSSGGTGGYWSCVSHPGSIVNASAGDLVFRQPLPGSTPDVVTQLLTAMGLHRTHVGMDTGSHAVLNNTRVMSPSVVEQHCVGGVFGTCDEANVDGGWLQNGGPGDGLQSENDGDFATGYYSTILKSANPTAAAAAIAWLTGELDRGLEYSLFAYTNESVGFILGGDMCSGTMFEALKASSSGAWFGLRENNWTYTPAWRLNAANTIFTALEGFVNNTTVSVFNFGMNGAEVAAQVVNCFATDSCYDQTAGWSATPGAYHYVGSGSTFSPDDLVEQISWGWYGNYIPGEVPAQAVPTTQTCTYYY